jgi:rhomboid family GlyGly-CTERM serine protease
MNPTALSLTVLHPDLTPTPAPTSKPHPKSGLWLFALALLALNLPVLFGRGSEPFSFSLEAVHNGQWWRLFSHPFVHVSWYHLLLDGAAFLTLYQSLLDPSWLRRVSFVAASAAGSLVTSWAATDLSAGLCGLSGVAHGLMAVSAIELVANFPSGSSERRVGWISLGLVLAKAGCEALTGQMFLGFLHFGLLGTPVAVSHAGGVLGGLAAWLLLSLRGRLASPSRIQTSPARVGLSNTLPSKGEPQDLMPA